MGTQVKPAGGKGDDVMTKEQTRHLVTDLDCKRLQILLAAARASQPEVMAWLEALQRLLETADVIPAEDVPPDVVTMNSVVRIKDLDTGEERSFALVFPNKTGMGEKAVSVLAPIGCALIGCREGDSLNWEVPAGTRRIQITQIVYQPERIGNYEL